MGQPDTSTKGRRIRRDGWTPERQLRFLDALACTRSVTKAAASVGVSRESAYRLRARQDGALFAALWDRSLQPDAAGRPEDHSHAMGDGRLARLLGTHYRRERGDFSSVGSTAAESLPA
jgi:hypothetical protein